MADELDQYLERFRDRFEPLRDRALWRKSRHPGIFVLVKLARLDLEEKDAPRAAVKEPQPMQMSSPPSWWEQPYPGGPMIKVTGFPRALYPPDSASKGKVPSVNGSDSEAYKRVVSRAGRWPWGSFDQAFSNAFSHGKAGGNVKDSGIAGIQRQGSIDPSGWVGEKTFNLLRSIRIPVGLDHAGEPAMDAPAVNLINQAYQHFHNPPGGIAEVKDSISDYLLDSIRAEPKWHYSQARPMSNLGQDPSKEQTADCSTQSTSAYFWAKEETGVAVPDPNHSGYNGYGYTGTLIQNPKVSSPFQVGDLALYGSSPSNTSHVCTCYEEGNSTSSEWCSHGSEAAPYAVELHYRSDLIYVVRPGLMP